MSMTLRNRFILVGLGVAIFVIATPIAALYALGYKYDIHTGQITKTGSLVIRSEPRKAQVYLNDVLQDKTTDTTIRFLLAGDYVIKVSKDGYQSWTKRLNIKNGLVTWANQDREFITLFYSTAKKESEQAISLALPDKNNTNAVVVTNNQINLYNPDRASSQVISGSTPIFTPPTSLPEKSSLYYILRYATAKAWSTEQITASRHLEANDNYAALLSGTDLMQSKNGQIELFANNVSGFTLDNEHVWYAQGRKIMHANWNLGVIEEVATLPFEPTNAKIIRGGQYIFAVLDNTLYMINEQADEIYRGVDYAYWDDNTSQLVFGNKNEALVLEPKNLRIDLIIRSTSTIGQPTINQKTGYLFFINENKIKAIELDGRDHRNVYTLADQPAESFLLSDDGKLLTAFTESEMTVYEIRQ